MLIELWERLRGYDKWIQTDATIKSSRLEQVLDTMSRSLEPIYRWQGSEEISWTDKDGVQQCEPLVVSEDSPVFKMYDGNALVIRYDPACPSHFYVHEQLRYQVNFAGKISIAFLVVLVAILITVLN